MLSSLRVTCNGVMKWTALLTTPFFPCSSLETVYVFGFCGCKNTCVLHNFAQLKFISGSHARPVTCPVCKRVHFLLAHSDAGLGKYCPAVTSAVFFVSVLRMENFSWEPKLLSLLIFFQYPAWKTQVPAVGYGWTDSEETVCRRAAE